MIDVINPLSVQGAERATRANEVNAANDVVVHPTACEVAWVANVDCVVVVEPNG